jgi:hypothetical protein
MNLDTMRADYVTVRRWWRDAEGWSEADLDEADRGVKEAVDKGDPEIVACWACWLAGLAEGIRRMNSMTGQQGKQ